MTYIRFRSILNNAVKLRRFIGGRGMTRDEMLDERMRQNRERLESLDE